MGVQAVPALCAVIIIQPAQTGAPLLGQSDEIAAKMAGERCQPLSAASVICGQYLHGHSVRGINSHSLLMAPLEVAACSRPTWDGGLH